LPLHVTLAFAGSDDEIIAISITISALICLCTRWSLVRDLAGPELKTSLNWHCCIFLFTLYQKG
jgi:hypothetical protein